MFDGAPFGFDGEIRVSFAGTGDRATMTADDATGMRVVFTLTRVKTEEKAAEQKKDEKQDGEKKDGEKKDGEKKDGEKKDGEKKDGAAVDKEKAERANLWKDRLPFPFGEHGFIEQPV
ncbi:MAG: hypothetical protein ACK5C3_14625, partial [bacterium]